MGGKDKEQKPIPAGIYTIWRVRKYYVSAEKGNMLEMVR
jgi:hypothetical protein